MLTRPWYLQSFPSVKELAHNWLWCVRKLLVVQIPDHRAAMSVISTYGQHWGSHLWGGFFNHWALSWYFRNFTFPAVTMNTLLVNYFKS